MFHVADEGQYTRSPTFTGSHVDAILRRQTLRQRLGELKSSKSPSRFSVLSNDFEFAGWGSVSYLDLRPSDIQKGEDVVGSEKDSPIFGPWMASSVAANEVFGSVFYAFPPVVAAAGV